MLHRLFVVCLALFWAVTAAAQQGYQIKAGDQILYRGSGRPQPESSGSGPPRWSLLFPARGKRERRWSHHRRRTPGAVFSARSELCIATIGVRVGSRIGPAVFRKRDLRFRPHDRRLRHRRGRHSWNDRSASWNDSPSDVVANRRFHQFAATKEFSCAGLILRPKPT